MQSGRSTCRHARTNAYLINPHKKIVGALGRDAAKAEAARSFGVSRSSVKRHAKLVERRRPLVLKKRPGLKPKLDRAAERLLERNLKERPAEVGIGWSGIPDPYLRQA